MLLNNKYMIIPNKKGVEILVKKVFKLLFPFNEKISDPEIPDPGKMIKEQLEIILSGLIPENGKVTEQCLDNLTAIKKTLLGCTVYS